MIIKQILLLILGLVLLFNCKRIENCIGIQSGSYKGHAILFYYKPVTGATIEMFIIPLCGDKNQLKRDFEQINFKQSEIMLAVKTGIFSSSEIMRNISMISKRIKLANTDSLASEYQVVHAALVDIDFIKVQNDTKAITGENQGTFSEIFNFQNKSSFKLKYFFSYTIEINNVKAI